LRVECSRVECSRYRTRVELGVEMVVESWSEHSRVDVRIVLGAEEPGIKYSMVRSRVVETRLRVRLIETRLRVRLIETRLRARNMDKSIQGDLLLPSATPFFLCDGAVRSDAGLVDVTGSDADPAVYTAGFGSRVLVTLYRPT